MFTRSSVAVLLVAGLQGVVGAVTPPHTDQGTCQKTTVAILGGGMAGVAAAQTLSNSSVHDFLILEYRDRIGGRAWHEPFGKDKDGKPYTIEMGCNWVQGLGNPGGPENPVWTLAKTYDLKTHYSNYDNVSTYNEHGYKDYLDLQDEYDVAYEDAEERAGRLLKDNLQDSNTQTGLAMGGWRTKPHDMEAQAIEWWNWDFECCYAPQDSSLVFGIAGSNLTFNTFSDEDNFVIDPRGFSSIIDGMASEFLKKDDPRVRLNTHITDISYTDDGVTVHNADGSCVRADYAIATFSLGVLQNDAVSFEPRLPDWKRESIHKFTMGTYTKIFLQFPETFWPADTEFFLYADPHIRGWYPIFQSLSTPGFLPGSNILFVTVTNELAWRAERQGDEKTKAEIMAVLRSMFPDKKVPEPTAFKFPRWSTEPWSYGSYSNWPASTTLEMHQNLRANLGRLWFAGEATSPTYFGFLHGAWFEGRAAGREIAASLHGCKGKKVPGCRGRKHYELLRGTTQLADYSMVNGWNGNSFYESDPEEE
ncbi:amine oxidase [Aspergillus campestris IBT 28561]|uniref:Amine oxidase n=1 Tax=Aspergillus campestris (strain IBT 28561) TaxID=1392248 RepID=A0A2I1CTX8_ASPC2|nr:amine oxidase [Aspergillus campestris IBT 28561]PKY01078.1 amine oxidase [Aspergillus campestris IBT 28561]